MTERRHFISGGRPDDPIYTLGGVLIERGFDISITQGIDPSDPSRRYLAMSASLMAAQALRQIEKVPEFMYLRRIQNTWPPVDENSNPIDRDKLYWDESTFRRVTATYFVNARIVDLEIANQRWLQADLALEEAKKYEDKARQLPWYKKIPLLSFWIRSDYGLYKFKSEKEREKVQYYNEEGTRYDRSAKDNDRWAKDILQGLKPLAKHEQMDLIEEIVDRYLPSPLTA